MNWTLYMNLALLLAAALAVTGWRRAVKERRELWDEFDTMRELAEGWERAAQSAQEIADSLEKSTQQRINELIRKNHEAKEDLTAAEQHAQLLNQAAIDLKSELDRVQAVPPIEPQPLPLLMPNPLSAEEVRRILGSTLPETPWWKLVNQKLAAETEEAMNRVSDARMADKPGSLAHSAGALEMLLALRTNWEADRVDAHRIREREERRAA